MADISEIQNYCLSNGYNVYQIRGTEIYVSEIEYITVNKEDGNVVVTFVGAPEVVQNTLNTFKQMFKITESYVNWVYDQQYLSTISIPLEGHHLPKSCFYPFLGEESLSDYYKRFMTSDASILILIGVPGSGKTSFLRGMVVETGENAIVTYHQKLLENDELFGMWFQSKENLLIIEDADTMLAPRKDGNSMMDRFLNIGDGLVSMKKKKLIFSTNLPSVSSIDEALLRPGRCHDILSFGTLNRKQAEMVSKECDVVLSNDQTEYTIAEIFSDVKTRKVQKKQSFGFL